MFHYVYVLQSPIKEVRIGYTLDLARGISEQNQDRRPWRVIYCEVYLHLSDAMRRVQHLKSISGAKLINQKLRSYLWR